MGDDYCSWEGGCSSDYCSWEGPQDCTGDYCSWEGPCNQDVPPCTSDYCTWEGPQDCTQDYCSWEAPNQCPQYGQQGGCNVQNYDYYGNCPWHGYNYGQNSGSQTCNSDIVSQILKVVPGIAGSALEQWLKSRYGGTSTESTRNTALANTLMPGAGKTAAALESGYGSILARGLMPTQAWTPMAGQYMQGAQNALMSGTSPEDIMSQLFLSRTGVGPQEFYPGEQYGKAEESLNRAQALGRTGFARQTEQALGNVYGSHGRGIQAAEATMADYLNQLEQQKVGLYGTEAQAMQRAQLAAPAEQRAAIQGYLGTAPYGAARLPQTLGFLDYFRVMQNQEEARKMGQYEMPALAGLSQLLGSYLGHPIGVTGTAAGTTQYNPQSWLAALAPMMGQYGTSLTDILMKMYPQGNAQA